MSAGYAAGLLAGRTDRSACWRSAGPSEAVRKLRPEEGHSRPIQAQHQPAIQRRTQTAPIAKGKPAELASEDKPASKLHAPASGDGRKRLPVKRRPQPALPNVIHGTKCTEAPQQGLNNWTEEDVATIMMCTS